MGSSSRWRRRAGISSGISLDADATGGVHESSRSTGGCTIEIMAEGPGQGEAGESDAAQRESERMAALTRAIARGSNLVAEIAGEIKDLDAVVDDRSGFTPLIAAARMGNLSATRALCAAGADPNRAGQLGMRPLAFAALQGHVPVARLLLRRSAEAGHQDEMGKTAAEHARDAGHRELSLLLRRAESKQKRRRRRRRLASAPTVAVQCGVLALAAAAAVALAVVARKRRLV
jgi:hypothetical protein